MPENYSLTTNTDHITTIFSETTRASTTGEVAHRYESIRAPGIARIISGKPIPLTREDGIKLMAYDFVNPLHVDRIIFSPPATIVFWKDGTKTVVKCAKGEPFSEYNGFAAALLKKVFGSNSAVKKLIQRKKQYDASAKATPASAQTTTLEQRFKELVNEYERLKNRAENLNLYLNKLRVAEPWVFKAVRDKMNGMPGYESEMEETHGN